MKRQFLLILLAFLFTLNTNAQDSQLFDYSWSLENVIINSINNFPPSNSEVATITLEFNDISGNDFLSRAYNDLFGDVTYNDPNSTFIFTYLAKTFSVPNLPENQAFEITYFDDFYFANQDNPFTYAITNNTDASKTLTITSANGDQAIYNGAILKVNTLSKLLEIEIAPNPVIDVITVKNKSKSSDLKVIIFDLKGQLKQSFNIEGSSNSTINIEKLTTGVYFFVFETNDGRKTTKKIIKK